MSNTIIEEVKALLAESEAGVKHESELLITALKGLLSHHNTVANGTVETPVATTETLPVSDVAALSETPTA